MSRYKAYTEYKDSGFEWFGLVPVNWEASRLKFESLINMGQSPSSEDCNQDGIGFPFLQGNAEFGVKSPTAKNYCEKPRKIANKGQLLFSVRAPVGALNFADQLYGIGRGLCSIENRADLSTNFLWWLIDIIKVELDTVSTGSTFDAVSAEQVGNSIVFCPPFNEQVRIANFLDHETAKIDALIEKQQALIELLKEKRQAVISHAVTKGLNPAAPMKDSGVEWLDEIPAHWELRAVSKLSTKITNGYVGPTRDILVDEGVPYIQATHIKNGKINFDNAYFVRQAWNEIHAKSILQPGDVLIVQTGAGTGDIGLVTENEAGFNCHALIIVRPDPSVVSGAFLSVLFQSSYGCSVLYSIRTGGMHPHLNCGEVQFVKIPVPPLEEQDAIMSLIHFKTRMYDALIDRQINAIDLMQERRTALISAAVTGKIDVRDWQAPVIQSNGSADASCNRSDTAEIEAMTEPAP